MSLKPSVKDFVLQYFDRLGATITEADDVYSVTPPADGADTWAFANPFVFSFRRKDDDAGVHIAIGSPVLKQIIDDAAQRGKVTSRHLAANRVPTAALFAEKLGLSNGTVKGFSMVEADTATALCFAHLITYDAPAFGKSEAEIQMDVLDAKSGERDDFMSAELFNLVTVPYKPEMGMPADKIDWLHERSRYLSNYRSEKRARDLEKDLALRWQVEEARISKYYDQLAQGLKDKENTLVTRIETLETKLAEAKNGTATKEKLQAELETTWARLNELNATVEASLQEIQEGRSGKLAAEQVRHELTVRSELVNVSYLAYDVVTFRVALEGPGKPGEVLLRYVPVRDDLDLPPCPHCGRTMHGASLDVDGHLVCVECIDACPRCKQAVCPDCRKAASILGSCRSCQGTAMPAANPPTVTPAPAAAPHPVSTVAPQPAATVAPQPAAPVTPLAHVHALIAAPDEALAPTPAPPPAKPAKIVALPTTNRRPAAPASAAPADTPYYRQPVAGAHRGQTPADAAPTRGAAAPARHQSRSNASRQANLPKVNRSRTDSQAPARVETRMCPHCQSSTQERFVSCHCCGVSVCQSCLGARQRYCQTCVSLGVPRHEPQWVMLVKQSHKNLARAKRYMVSANQRYGVVHWQGFMGETVVVFDLWQKQVAAVRHGGLLRSLRPKP